MNHSLAVVLDDCAKLLITQSISINIISCRKSDQERTEGGGEGYLFQATRNKNNLTNRTTGPGEVTDYNYLHNTTVVPRVYARVCRITVNKERK